MSPAAPCSSTSQASGPRGWTCATVNAQPSDPTVGRSAAINTPSAASTIVASWAERVGLPLIPVTRCICDDEFQVLSANSCLPTAAAVPRAMRSRSRRPPRAADRRVVAARHAHALDTGGVGALHVARRVADDDGVFRAEVSAVHQRRPRECDAGDLAAVTRVGAVAAEREEPVQPCAVQLDVGGGLDVSGHQAER